MGTGRVTIGQRRRSSFVAKSCFQQTTRRRPTPPNHHALHHRGLLPFFLVFKAVGRASRAQSDVTRSFLLARPSKGSVAKVTLPIWQSHQYEKVRGICGDGTYAKKIQKRWKSPYFQPLWQKSSCDCCGWPTTVSSDGSLSCPESSWGSRIGRTSRCCGRQTTFEEAFSLTVLLLNEIRDLREVPFILILTNHVVPRVPMFTQYW